jgi:hypothetical protein
VEGTTVRFHVAKAQSIAYVTCAKSKEHDKGKHYRSHADDVEDTHILFSTRHSILLAERRLYAASLLI